MCVVRGVRRLLSVASKAQPQPDMLPCLLSNHYWFCHHTHRQSSFSYCLVSHSRQIIIISKHFLYIYWLNPKVDIFPLYVMESQKFNLCWNEFDKAASTMLKNLVSDQIFTDVTISCDSDQTIQVNRKIKIEWILWLCTIWSDTQSNYSTDAPNVKW